MKLMIIDGNSIINRAFYGIRMLTTRDGTPTNAVYGFLAILQKLLDEEQPEALCVAFDLKGPTFRHLQYEAYKGQRKGMPEELAVQMPILKEVLEAMHIPHYGLSGWEADDLIGTVAAINTKAGWETVVVTGDKDSLQLVSDSTRVKLVTTRMGQTSTKEMTPAAFEEEYGFPAPYIVDLKALMGDTSDNIPGVKGVGQKTAMGLIQMHHSIDEVYEKLPEVYVAPDTLAKAGVVKKLTEGKEDALMSYDLATIRCNAPLEFQPEEALRKPVDSDALYQLFLKLEFAKLIDKMGLNPGENQPAEEAQLTISCTGEVLTDSKRMEELLNLWKTLDGVNVLPLPSLDVLAVSWSVEKEQFAVLCRADQLDCYDQLLQGLFSADIKKISHGVKHLMNLLIGQELSTEGFVFDTELAAYLLAPTEGSYELEKLGMIYYNQKFAKSKDYLDADAFSPLADTSIPMGALFSHCALIGALHESLSKKLTELGMDKLYYDIELPLCPVLAEMEQAGFLVDRKALRAFGLMLEERIQRDKAEIYQLAGEEFNINSPKQLGVILFETLGLPPVKKTKTGYSTNVEVLEKLVGQHPIIEKIMDYRQLTKLNSTYVEGLTKVIAQDGRIHTSFQNTVTATGRLSSTEPNLQNIPIRTQLGAELRKMFVAESGKQLVDADYSQVELRLLAHMAEDEVMLNAFCTGEDIHSVTASQVFGVPQEEVTSEMRRHAKAVNFGIVYGISDFSLSQDIGVFRQEARAYMDKYFEKYSGVRAYMDGIVVQAKADGYVSTLMGRRRWLPELKSSNHNLRSFGERVALNMPIQGTAADLMKLAMIRVRDALLAEGLEGRLVLQVHDELIVECPDREVEQVKALLSREMEGVMELLLPLKADAAAGQSWASAK